MSEQGTTGQEQNYKVRKYVKRTKPMQYSAAYCVKQRTNDSNKTLALMFNTTYDRLRFGIQRVRRSQLPDSDDRDRTLTTALLHRPMSEWGSVYKEYKGL